MILSKRQCFVECWILGILISSSSPYESLDDPIGSFSHWLRSSSVLILCSMKDPGLCVLLKKS